MATTTRRISPAQDIRVLGLGDQDWTADDAGFASMEEEIAHRRAWERYGTVRVQVGAVVYAVGCTIGVPESLRGTALAAGGDTVTPYLSAWYEDSADWSLAPGEDGSEGVPEQLADAVRGAIRHAARRLWAEAQAEAENEA